MKATYFDDFTMSMFALRGKFRFFSNEKPEISPQCERSHCHSMLSRRKTKSEKNKGTHLFIQNLNDILSNNRKYPFLPRRRRRKAGVK